jgi:hypothetical protein
MREQLAYQKLLLKPARLAGFAFAWEVSKGALTLHNAKPVARIANPG